MPNARDDLTGATTINVDGKTYRLSFSVNAICALEDALDENIGQIAASMTNEAGLRFGRIRTVFWASLIDHWPEVTEKEAGQIMTKLGAVKALETIALALQRAFPEVENERPLAVKMSSKRASIGRRS